jgi:hypothetical protein
MLVEQGSAASLRAPASGSLIHVDVTEFGNMPDGGRHKFLDPPATELANSTATARRTGERGKYWPLIRTAKSTRSCHRQPLPPRVRRDLQRREDRHGVAVLHGAAGWFADHGATHGATSWLTTVPPTGHTHGAMSTTSTVVQFSAVVDTRCLCRARHYSEADPAPPATGQRQDREVSPHAC